MLFRIICAVSLLAGPAFGLSCIPPNFAERFNEAAAAEEMYSLVYGVFEPMVPEGDLADAEAAPYIFDGKQLGREGFGQTQAREVVVERTCAGSFCGPFPPSGVPMMALLEHRGTAQVLTADPCGNNVKLEPSFGQVGAIRACMTSLECGADEIGAFAVR